MTTTQLSVFKLFVLVKFLLLIGFFPACNDVNEGRGPVIQPKKEATWVRTEKVRTTKEEVFSGKKNMLAKIPINVALEERIVNNKYTDPIIVSDKASCHTRLNPLDERRTAIQKAGGMWHAFERNANSKPYSFNGMQLDSNINKIFFGLKYLCQTSQGVPLNDLAVELNKLIKAHGREKAEKLLIAGGEHPEDVKELLDYEEFARKINVRKVDFKMIGPRFGQAERLMDLYEDLSTRQVDAKSMNVFLSDSVTLLKVLNAFIHQNQIMVMALKEDKAVPYHHEDQDM